MRTMAAPIHTLGELRQRYGSTPRTVKEEIRDNLVRKLQSGERLFPGVIGYDDTVIPQLVNAILSRHNFILLGLRVEAEPGAATRRFLAAELGRRLTGAGVLFHYRQQISRSVGHPIILLDYQEGQATATAKVPKTF